MIKLTKIGTDDRYRDDVYFYADGSAIRREDGLTPNGNQLYGSWVLRDLNGNFVDCNKYRSDLMEAHGYQYPDESLNMGG